MGKIITVTLHPAIDKILKINNFQVGTVCTAQTSFSYPAGKGINVARTLGCLHQPVLSIAWIGRDDLPFFETIQNEYVTPKWILTPTPTRTNLTIHDPIYGNETHIRENQLLSSQVFPLKEIIQILQDASQKDDLLILSGSLPPHAPSHALYEIGKALKGKCHIVIDSSGPQMTKALDCGPDLIKPNLEELEQIMQEMDSTQPPLQTWKEIGTACRQLSQMKKIGMIVVSLGKDGALLYDSKSNRTIRASIDLSEYPSPLPTNLNTVGCGDAMVAGLCYEWVRNSDPATLLKKGVLTGTANLFNDLPGFVSSDVLATLGELITIHL